jgi:hypothetical protein
MGPEAVRSGKLEVVVRRGRGEVRFREDQGKVGKVKGGVSQKGTKGGDGGRSEVVVSV